MRKEFGKWLLDIAKYITTAVILSSVFGEANDWIIYLAGPLAVLTILTIGLIMVSGHSVGAILKILKIK